MAWFEISGNRIVSRDYNHWSKDNGTVWGLNIGGRWCLDYTWKFMFGISTDDWNNRCSSIKTDNDFYNFCEWLGIWYKKDGIIYRRGEKYNKLHDFINDTINNKITELEKEFESL